MSSTRCHTFTGTGFDVFNPRPEDVRLEDIAHHLALTNRFGGATPVPYSVAQHAVSVGRLVLQISGDPLWALQGLHHDSAEAYVGDQRRPIKRFLRYYCTKGEEYSHFEALETEAQWAIYQAFGLDDSPKFPDSLIDAADLAMLHAELLGLFGEEIRRESWILASPVRIPDCMSWREAEAAFLAAHHDLMAQVKAAGKC